MEISDITSIDVVVPFDSSNPNWSDNPQYNEMFFRMAFNYLLGKLSVRGHLFLNEVFDTLDIPRSREGAVLGWLSVNRNQEMWRWVDGLDDTFNVVFYTDGAIWDKI